MGFDPSGCTIARNLGRRYFRPAFIPSCSDSLSTYFDSCPFEAGVENSDHGQDRAAYVKPVFEASILDAARSRLSRRTCWRWLGCCSDDDDFGSLNHLVGHLDMTPFCFTVKKQRTRPPHLITVNPQRKCTPQ